MGGVKLVEFGICRTRGMLIVSSIYYNNRLTRCLINVDSASSICITESSGTYLDTAATFYFHFKKNLGNYFLSLTGSRFPRLPNIPHCSPYKRGGLFDYATVA